MAPPPLSEAVPTALFEVKTFPNKLIKLFDRETMAPPLRVTWLSTNVQDTIPQVIDPRMPTVFFVCRAIAAPEVAILLWNNVS